MGKLRAFIIIVAAVFVSSSGPIFLVNLTNLWEVPLSTWQTIVTAGVAGVVVYLIAVCAPIAIKPSAVLKLPEIG